MKIRLVEDSQVVREHLRSMMTCISDIDQVAEVDNEDDAMHEIFANTPDVVILDLTLIGGRGINVLRWIRLQTLSILVIVMTNHPQCKKSVLSWGRTIFWTRPMKSWCWKSC